MMIDRSRFHVEDFLVDPTFQLYCAGKDPLCVSYWEKYIAAHPEQAAVIGDAKRLYAILSGHKKSINNSLLDLKVKTGLPQQNETPQLLRPFPWLRIAAAILVISGLSFFVAKRLSQPASPQQVAISLFSTHGGERKKIKLHDGSTVILNANSALQIALDFNKKRREVTLVGEAFFDVVHCEDKPFQVHTEDFDINVLGTSFNVKAYPDEPTAEAVLIKGLIVMEGKGSKGSSITLKPSQKVIFYKKEISEAKKASTRASVWSHPQIAINEYTRSDDSSIVELAWTENRLEIQDESFADIKKTLERWYDVEIEFKDEEVKKYQFTATFNNETIVEVLNALQDAQHFKYEIKGKQITISK